MKIKKTQKKYRISVSKSISHVYATVLDSSDNILASCSTLSLDFKQANVTNCFQVGQFIGEKCLELNLKSLRFDRNGMLYHGRIKAIADGVRDKGLEF